MYFHAGNMCRRTAVFRALRQHQGEQATTAADVQNMVGAVNFCPGSQQYAVRPDRMGNSRLINEKTFEPKRRLSHDQYVIAGNKGRPDRASNLYVPLESR